MTDVDLFAHVVQQLQHGAPYYDTMGHALREGPGPAGSIFNWRPPLLYLVLAYWPSSMTNSAGFFLFSELWSGFAMVLSSLTARTRPTLSISLALLACLFRELALPYLLIRLALGWRAHRSTWNTAIFVLVVYYTLHWANVLHAQMPTDTLGPPWLAFQGLTFLRATVTPNPFCVVLGRTWGAYLWILGVAGVVMFSRQAVSDRLALGFYLLAFLVVGRAEPEHTNAYWGFLVLPLQAVTLWQAMMRGIDSFDTLILQSHAKGWASSWGRTAQGLKRPDSLAGAGR